MRQIVLAVLTLVAFIPTAIAQDGGPSPMVRFMPMTPYNVDAASFIIENQAHTPQAYPHVGPLAETPFDVAAQQWAEQRFVLTGSSVNKLRVTLREARITEKILPITKGIAGWFKKEEATEYEAALSLEIAIVDVNGQVLSNAEASTWVSQTLLERADSAEKQKTWVDMINKSFDNIDRELKPRLVQYMSAYIK
jgi:hypothetical protein